MAHVHDWALVSAITAPHVLYAAVWLHPTVWRRLFRRRPVTAFQRAAFIGKVGQATAFIAWFVAQTRLQGTTFSLWRVPPGSWLTFFTLLAAGQALNIGVYRAIGQDGVYYGTKLGKTVKWCSAFPFSVVPHPQYVGSALTVWGLVALLCGHTPGIVAVGALWSALYLMTGLIEEYL
ncbi:hypothetical protein WJX81_002088 [Elliptochloris bilobata]|uniref:phosphatidyl-N-methylethanolamine N-methyltransferase n=1 Tax=Elliptochloris bilobata TaxID=381761 RepID=A0AAW1QYS5_9CHLO